jgi:hypothetical protein
MRGLLASLLLLDPASAIEKRGPGYILNFDDRIWAEIAPVSPAWLQLRCIAHDCAPGTRLTLILDLRPLPRPGAGAFMPGAISGTILALRAQSLAPGTRLNQAVPVEPVRVGAISGYRARFAMEDRDLRASELVQVVLAIESGTLVLQLTAPRLGGRAGPYLDDLLASIRPMPAGPAHP